METDLSDAVIYFLSNYYKLKIRNKFTQFVLKKVAQLTFSNGGFLGDVYNTQNNIKRSRRRKHLIAMKYLTKGPGDVVNIFIETTESAHSANLLSTPQHPARPPINAVGFVAIQLICFRSSNPDVIVMQRQCTVECRGRVNVEEFNDPLTQE